MLNARAFDWNWRNSFGTRARWLNRNEPSMRRCMRRWDARQKWKRRRAPRHRAGSELGSVRFSQRRDGREISGILGTLSELCVPRDPAHGEALAVALGGRMHSVIVESDAVAEAASSTFVEQARTRIIPPTEQGRTGSSEWAYGDDLAEGGRSGIRFRIAGIRSEDRTSGSHGDGERTARRYPRPARRMMGGVRLVTLSGDLIESSGGMHGGSRRRTAATFGGRGREAKELERVRTDLDRLMLIKDTAEGALRACRDQQRALQDALNELASDDHASRRAQWLGATPTCTSFARRGTRRCECRRANHADHRA